MADGNENATKRLIRRTATRLFRERSFEEVTLSDICRASGINKHTFYYYFKSKDELLEYYYSFPWNLSPAETADILTSENYADQLWIILNKFISFFEKSGIPILRQVFIKNLNEDKGTFRVKPEQKEIFKLEVSIIRKGQETEQFRNHSDPKVLAILLHQVLFSLGLLWTVFKGMFDFGASARFLVESLLEVDTAYRASTEEDLNSLLRRFQDGCQSAETAEEDESEELPDLRRTGRGRPHRRHRI